MKETFTAEELLAVTKMLEEKRSRLHVVYKLMEDNPGIVRVEINHTAEVRRTDYRFNRFIGDADRAVREAKSKLEYNEWTPPDVKKLKLKTPDTKKTGNKKARKIR